MKVCIIYYIELSKKVKCLPDLSEIGRFVVFCRVLCYTFGKRIGETKENEEKDALYGAFLRPGLLIMAFAALPERFFVFRNRFEPERDFR